MTSILIASNNAHKLQEFQEIFLQFGAPEVALLTPASQGIDLAPEETAETYLANARIKARAFHEVLRRQERLRPDTWVMADDSGLEVAALDGAPGIRSARYHKAAPGGDGCAALLQEMTSVPDVRRSARFRAVIVFIGPDGHEYDFEGVCEGSIGKEKRGAGGFGFDPVFRMPEDGRHMAELSSREKHRLSHRGIAAQKVIAFLKSQGV